jgi:hypothetical protein
MTGAPTIQPTSPLNLRRFGYRLPKMGNCLPLRMRNHRCVQARERQEPVEVLLHAQKSSRALAEPPANRARLVLLAHGSTLLLELQHHGSRRWQAAYHWCAWLPCAVHLYSLHLRNLATDFRC